MPLDRLVELRIFDRISQVPRGNPALVETVWADRQGASVEHIQEQLASLDGVLFVDYRLRWRQDIESIIPGYLRLRDEDGKRVCSERNIDRRFKALILGHSLFEGG